MKTNGVEASSLSEKDSLLWVEDTVAKLKAREHPSATSGCKLRATMRSLLMHPAVRLRTAHCGAARWVEEEGGFVRILPIPIVPLQVKVLKDASIAI